LVAASEDPAIEEHIQSDLEIARRLGVQRSPTIYVNGKLVQIWRTPGLLQRILAAAAEDEPRGDNAGGR
jgi:protein-disulfide isomerase